MSDLVERLRKESRGLLIVAGKAGGDGERGFRMISDTMDKATHEIERLSARSETSEQACIDIYMDFHVSEIGRQAQSIQRAWKVGQEARTRIVNREDLSNKPEK